MTPASAVNHASAVPMASVPARIARGLATIENAALALVFAVTVALPLAEIVLRALFDTGIQGVPAYIQHFTLALGMLGAAVAAREQRLLALAVTTLFKGRGAHFAGFVAGAASVAVTALIGLGALQFVRIEHEAGVLLTYGLPVWILQLPLPLGYGLIALRLAGHAAATLGGRCAVLALAAAMVAAVHLVSFDAASTLAAGLMVLAIAALLGAPIFVIIGGTALLLLLAQGVPVEAVAVSHYSLVINPSLPAIPMFTLAGYLLAESRAPRRLIEVFDALFGRLRGGAAIVTVLACTFFTSFTGASGVTVLALGGLVMPVLTASGFGPKRALGLVTGAGLPGVLLMPALPLILYAIVAGVSLSDMFFGALLPALLMLAITVAWGMRGQGPHARDAALFDWSRAGAALADAKWELSLPLIPIGALAGGFATPVEAAAITALYALIIVAYIHRDLDLARGVPRVMAECGLLVGGILLVLGVAVALTNYLVDAEIPSQLTGWVTQTIESRIVFLLALNVLLLAAGCLVDIFSAIVVLAPLIAPIGLAFGVHPVHLGIVFLANLELGYLTPPVGMNLFFASYRFGKPIGEVFRAVAPLFLALCAGVLAVTYIPWLSTGLPGLLNKP